MRYINVRYLLTYLPECCFQLRSVNKQIIFLLLFLLVMCQLPHLYLRFQRFFLQKILLSAGVSVCRQRCVWLAGSCAVRAGLSASFCANRSTTTAMTTMTVVITRSSSSESCLITMSHRQVIRAGRAIICDVQ